MKKRIAYFSILVITFILSIFYTGCDDSGLAPTKTVSGFKPTMRIHQGARYIYTNDSLLNNNGSITTQRTSITTYDTVRAPLTFYSVSCFPITSTSIGSTPIERDTFYVSYDSTAGKVYQFGIKQFINPLQLPSWDLVADFSIARGSTWSVGDINSSVIIPGLGNIDFTGPLTGKVADSTIVNTTATPSTAVHCYRIELNASLSGSVAGQTVTASIIIDYYLGYYSDQFPNNPSGIIRITFRPFSFNVLGTPVFYQSGLDRILRNYTP